MVAATFLVARDIYSQSNGRKLVIRAALRAACRKYQNIDVFIFDDGDDFSYKEFSANVVVRYLGGMRFRIGGLINLIRGFLIDGLSFNEAIFPLVDFELLAASMRRAAFIYVDMIRLAKFPESLGLRFHLDMDDLLSIRYRGFAREKYAGLGFGYARNGRSRAFSLLLNLLARKIFYLEARRLEWREKYWAERVFSVSLVSKDEAYSLSVSSGRAVDNIPMAIKPQCVEWSREGGAGKTLRGVFVGSLEVPGNMISLQTYLRECGGNIGFDLTIIGLASDESRNKLGENANINIVGYVDDISESILSSHFVFCPIYGGTGVKTKVVEALSYGIPIVTTPDGLSGLSAVDAGAYIFEEVFDVKDFILNYDVLSGVEAVKKRISYYEENFSSSVVEGKWARVFERYEFS